ncbi:MAG: helix-turn-helix domain-containing protein [Bacteroidales bacterium]|nr:helix-turn-helix domain-containing protein [Bacteroidales bacterium]
MTNNHELELAWNFVEKTDRNIFLTGKAGTGKTTFLHKIRNESLKRLVVVAPTGVAAINAKGVTIHSFFQMPFGPILPLEAQSSDSSTDTNGYGNSPSQKKFNKRKIDIIRSLDLLIIDEVSMVRADLLDGIDQVLRRYKNKNKVFGGVQVLMIGDLQQLAPVVKTEDWQILQDYYNTAFFFSSKAFKISNAIGIELKLIYRQKNEQFIGILNEIRNNCLSAQSLNALNQRCNPDFKPAQDEGYINLTTHNAQANDMNERKLIDIKRKSHYFTATVEGDFPENIYPTHFKLELKVGAQVMFIKNDSSPDKKYFNGKIGKIVKFEDNQVIVRCPDDKYDIETKPETWENINYSLNQETKEIAENVKGTFSQIPLRLAWAITIHKSQGLTFNKAIINVASSFAHGQTYVALSRCRTLEGIVLNNPIDKKSIIHDNRVVSFTKEVEDNPPDINNLNQSQKHYQLNLMEELFNYKQLIYPVNRCNKIAYQSGNSLKGNITAPLKTIKENGIGELIKLGESFHKQLMKMSINQIEPENNPLIQERIKKAVSYFINHSQEYFVKPLSELTYSTDNKAIEKDLKEQLKKINEQLESKLYCLNGLKDGFNTIKYLELRAKSILQKSKTTKLKTPNVDTSSHPKLFSKLRQWRHDTAHSEEVEHYKIFTQKSLYEICEKLPFTNNQLHSINGMGKVRVSKYGDEIIEIVRKYCEENEIELIEEQVQEKPKKENTKLISLKMLNEGLSINDIAKAREFAISTIEGHLSHYILTGELKLEKLMNKEKYIELKQQIEETEFEGLGELKNKLNDKYSYGEIKMVLNDIKFHGDLKDTLKE